MGATMTEVKPGMIVMGDFKTFLTPEEYEARQVAQMGQYMNKAVAFLDAHPEATASVFTVVSLRGWYDVRVSRRPPRTEPAEPIPPVEEERVSERPPAAEVLLDELLAEMRRHYEHATFANNILVGGELRLRCRRCLRAPVPREWVMRALCEPCLDQANREGT